MTHTTPEQFAVLYKSLMNDGLTVTTAEEMRAQRSRVEAAEADNVRLREVLDTIATCSCPETAPDPSLTTDRTAIEDSYERALWLIGQRCRAALAKEPT